MKGARAALALLTRIPARDPEVWPRYTVAWFWLPGILAGIIWYIAIQIFGATGAGMIAAIGGEAVLTGGLHWKGLAKVVDAWSAPRQDRSQVRRSAGVGAVGVLFVTLALLAFWTLWQHGGAVVPAVWLMPPLWARAIMAWASSWRRIDPSSAWTTRVGKETGSGSGAWMALAVAMLLGLYVMGFRAIDVFGGSLILVGLFLWWGMRKFSGLNEDLLFASAILTEIIALYLIVATTPTNGLF